MKKRLVIRADGGNGIGMGHIVRTVALAEVLTADFEVVYVCDKRYQAGTQYVTQKGFKVCQTDEVNLYTILESIGADIILTDSYRIDMTYINWVRQAFQYVIYIDDNVLYEYKADMVINQNFGAEHLQYPAVKTALLGSQYLMLREDFREVEPITIKEKVENILITVGGTDIHDITGNLLRKINALECVFNVVIGANFPYEARLREEFNQTNIIFHKLPNMKNLMSQCDMAISSCGSTLYELGVLGIPTVGIIVVDNQQPLAVRMAKDEMICLPNRDVTNLEYELLDDVRGLADDIDLRKQYHSNMVGRLNNVGVLLIAQEIVNNYRKECS